MKSILSMKSLNVLVCDDKAEFLFEIVKFLELVCHKVYSAKDGKDGYELFLQHQQEIDVIITDVKMPNIDGLSLSRMIREIDETNKQIIMVSAFDDLDYIREAVSLNITRFLAKPIENDLLLCMLQEIATIKNEKMQQKEMHELLDLTDNYVYISKTDTEGIINYVSNAFCKVSGYTKEELLGRPHNIVRHKDMPKEAFADMWKTISSGKVWQGEVKNRKKNGGYYWVYATVSPIIEQGSIVGYKSIRVDITNKKELELLNNELEEKVEAKVKAIREKDEMLQIQSRNALMGEMISMIAHQWRQPLSTISLIVNDLSMKYHLGTLNAENLQLSVEKSNHTIQYMSKTIDDFREFFKPDKSKELISIEKCVDESINFIEPLIKKFDIELSKNISSDNKIAVYKNELLQVLINIIKNAIDAIVDNKIENAKISIDISDTPTHKIIIIQDNAGGIPQDILQKIFEPYFSTKEKNGTGLGLYMSKTIIEEHLLGKLNAKNSTDGAIFEILIPFEEGKTI